MMNTTISLMISASLSIPTSLLQYCTAHFPGQNVAICLFYLYFPDLMHTSPLILQKLNEAIFL